MKKFIKLVLCLFMIFCINIPVFASEPEPLVVFDGSEEEFVFMVQSTKDGYPDLFTSLKDLVPGDEIIQQIKLKVVNLKTNEKVKIYLKAENKNDDYQFLESLKDISLSVEKDDENITNKISSPLLLGEFSKNDEIFLNVKLSIPTSIGNEIANLDANVDWVFSAEITTNSKPPQTGDDSDIKFYALVILFSLVLIAVLIFIKKRKI